MTLLSFNEEVNSTLLIFEITGMQYFSLNKLTKHNVHERPSIFRLFGVLLVISLIVVMMVFTVTLVPDSLIEKNEALRAKNVLLFTIASSVGKMMILCVICCVLESYTSSRDMKKLFLNSKEIVETIHREFNIIVDLKQIRRSALKRFVAMTIFFMSIHVPIIYFLRHSGMMIFVLLVITPPIIFLLLSVHKFIFFVAMVNSQIEALTSILARLFDGKPIEVDHVHLKSYNAKPSKTRIELSIKLQAAKHIYDLIHENGELVNRSHGLTVLVFIVLTIVMLIARTYEIIITYIGALPMEKLPGAVYSNVLASAVILSTVAYCQRTKSLVSSRTSRPWLVLTFIHFASR